MLHKLCKLLENFWIDTNDRTNSVAANENVNIVPEPVSNSGSISNSHRRDFSAQAFIPSVSSYNDYKEVILPKSHSTSKNSSVLDRIIPSHNKSINHATINNSFNSSTIRHRKRHSSFHGISPFNQSPSITPDLSEYSATPAKKRCLTYPVYRQYEKDVFADLIRLYTEPDSAQKWKIRSNFNIDSLSFMPKFEDEKKIVGPLSPPCSTNSTEPIAASTATKKPTPFIFNSNNQNQQSQNRFDQSTYETDYSPGFATSSSSLKNYPKKSFTPKFRNVYEAMPFLNDNYFDNLNCDQIKEQWNQEAAKAEAEMKFWEVQKHTFQHESISKMNHKLNCFLRERPILEDVYLTILPELEWEEKINEFPELSQEMIKIIQSNLHGPDDDPVSHGFRTTFTKQDLRTLCGLSWLSDKVINFYMELILARSEIYSDCPPENSDYQKFTHSAKSQLPSVAIVNSFFYVKLCQSGYDSIKRWTRRSNIFKKDLLFVPIHLGVHWCMVCVDLRKKSVTYFDSMGGPNPTCLRTIMDFLEKESLDKEKQALNRSQWKLGYAENYPQQGNGSDCGVFSCVCAEFLSRDRPLEFSQEHMPYLRTKIQYEILQKTLISPI